MLTSLPQYVPSDGVAPPRSSSNPAPAPGHRSPGDADADSSQVAAGVQDGYAALAPSEASEARARQMRADRAANLGRNLGYQDSRVLALSSAAGTPQHQHQHQHQRLRSGSVYDGFDNDSQLQSGPVYSYAGSDDVYAGGGPAPVAQSTPARPTPDAGRVAAQGGVPYNTSDPLMTLAQQLVAESSM